MISKFIVITESTIELITMTILCKLICGKLFVNESTNHTTSFHDYIESRLKILVHKSSMLNSSVIHKDVCQNQILFNKNHLLNNFTLPVF